MPVITTLMALKPLTKVISPTGSEPYPLIKNFTSIDVQTDTIEDFLDLIDYTANNTGCLLKGRITRPIQNEPRAGLTNPNEPTEWLVLDYDGEDGFDTVDALLTEIDPALAKADYIFQHSASSGIGRNKGIRGHVFVLLDKPVAPQVIKHWIKRVNLTVDVFRERVYLSKNGMSLVYPLDITVNQNDKLIYVAPPILHEIEDPILDRIQLVKKKYRKYSLDKSISTESNSRAELDLIQELRDSSGFEPRKPKYSTTQRGELLLNPASCVVTSVKEGEVYTRINLNGGDSWAYWHYNDDYEILHNFKGEPSVYLKDIAPDYYQQLRIAEETSHIKPFVFRDIKSDTYYNAEYNSMTGFLEFCSQASNKGKLADFLSQRGQAPMRVIQDWDMRFDPVNQQTVDFKNRIVNIYIPSAYGSVEPDPEITETHFPTITKVLGHICVDNATYLHYLNWLAHIIQFKTKTQTAWLFSGCEGTGKGVMFTHILRPLISQHHCIAISNDQLNEQFNGFLESTIICFVDEADAHVSANADKVMSKLKNWITEPTVTIRKMRSNAIEIPSFSNFILATNTPASIKISDSDRRWNIAPRQNTPIKLTRSEIFDRIPAELDSFAAFLKARPIEQGAATKILVNDHRDVMIELSKTIAEEFFDALFDGSLEFFTERLTNRPSITDLAYVDYARVVTQWVKTAGEPIDVNLNDLCQVYAYLCNKRHIGSKQFGHLASRYEFKSKRKVIKGIKQTVYALKFDKEDWHDNWLVQDKSIVAGSSAIN